MEVLYKNVQKYCSPWGSLNVSQTRMFLHSYDTDCWKCIKSSGDLQVDKVHSVLMMSKHQALQKIELSYIFKKRMTHWSVIRNKKIFGPSIKNMNQSNSWLQCSHKWSTDIFHIILQRCLRCIILLRFSLARTQTKQTNSKWADWGEKHKRNWINCIRSCMFTQILP